MNRPFDDVAKSLAAGEMSRRESLRRVGGLLGGSALAYFGIGCAPDADPVAPNLVRPTTATDVAALVGPTRFYLWEASTAPVSPAVDAGWQSSAAPFARRPMNPTPAVGDNLTTISGFSSAAGRNRCHRQFIGPPMTAGNVFDTSVTYKAYAQGLESAGNDNLRSRIGIRIVSRDGSTVRHTIKAIADYSSGTEWSTSLRSKAFLDGDAGTGSYTTVAGDRLVVEFGHRDASGASISGSSRWGSTATGGDIPENETTTSTSVRPWFECSLTVTFETAPQVTQVTRYVNTASTPGGDGTTNDTVGANRAFASLVTALTTLSATNWAAANQQLRILCSGTAPDTGDAVVTAAWNGRLSPECYLEIIGDQPSALAISTSHYRCVDTEPGGFGVYGGGYVRLSRVGYLITVGAGTGGYSVVGVVDNGAPMDVRFDRVRVDAVSIASGRTSTVHAFWTDAKGPANKVTYTNCAAVGWAGTGAEHHGFTKYPGTTGSVRLYNCTAHGCAAGFSGGSGMVAKNCGAAGCADGFSGTFDVGSTNNASNVASDAPGTNPQNGVTPTFVSAPADLHLASGDTAWKDRGANLSADALFPFATDGDGATRTSPWDIGVDESSFETPPPQVTQVTRYVNTASTPGGDGTTNDTVGANRAFASLVTALTTLSATNWAAANQQLRILCSGTAPDTGDAVVTAAWNGRLSPECYLEIIGDQPSALAISTSHYRCVDTEPGGFGVYGGGYVRLSRVGYLITVGAGTGGYSVLGILDNGAPMDVRFDRIRVEAVSISSSRTSSVHAFWTDASGPTNKVTFTNCVVVGWTGTGATHRGFTKYPGTTGSVRIYNGTAYGCGIGFASDGNGMLVKNCGAANCANGFNGTFDAASTNNASSLATDAPGINPRNSVTPTFVSAPSNLHLGSGDTAWTDRGADLSTDPLFPFSTDGDGATRTGTWEIGADG